MSIVTVPELRNYLSGIGITDTQKVSAELILDGVQSELETYLNRSVQQRRVIEYVPVTNMGHAIASNTPIMELYGVYGSDPRNTVVTPRPMPLLPGAWRPGQSYVALGFLFQSAVWVDYLGGYNGDKIPGLKLAILRVAAREFVHQHDDGMTVQNTEMRPPADPTPQPKGWQIEELTAFDRYRRRVMA